MMAHQYVQRRDAQVRTESFSGDPIVSFLYSRVRENAAWLFRALTSARLTQLMAHLRFDLRPVHPARMRQRLARSLALDFSECADPLEHLDTPRKVFERKIRYWDCRPMETALEAIVSPADARLLAGSLRRESALYLKGKFFSYEELLGETHTNWLDAFRHGDYAVLRLTPDKYHYTHTPVAGIVRDLYELDGVYQSCYPAVVVAQATPYSKNRRMVTIIDTDVPGGTQAGLVAMVEVVALLIGDLVQCYSASRYDAPIPIRPGLPLDRGAPKALFRPGSSTVVLLFQESRIRFCDDLLDNLRRADVRSHYSAGWGLPLVETDVAVRSTIAYARPKGSL